jgi:hypothetical protein
VTDIIQQNIINILYRYNLLIGVLKIIYKNTDNLAIRRKREWKKDIPVENIWKNKSVGQSVLRNGNG